MLQSISSDNVKAGFVGKSSRFTNDKLRPGPRVVVVGPDAAGKTTLVNHLSALGFNARSCAQDHSHVPDMWRRLSKPDFMVFLDAELETIARRRKIDWGQDRLDQLQERLANARVNCDLYLPTDDLDPIDVVTRVQEALSVAGIEPSGRASAP
jgi:guanylate kinase